MLAWAVWAFGTADFMATATACLFALLLATLAAVDLKTFYLPDILTLPGLVLGLVLVPVAFHTPWWAPVLGAVVGGGFFWVLGVVFLWLRGYAGLGFGDVKMLAMLGAWVGPVMLLPLLLCTCAVALPVLVIRRVVCPAQAGGPLPFGPFLAAGGWLAFVYGLFVWHLVMVAHLHLHHLVSSVIR